METAFTITTILTAIILLIFMAAGFFLVRSRHNNSLEQKVYTYSALALAIISIPRLILAINLGKDYIFLYWILVFTWSATFILSLISTKEH